MGYHPQLAEEFAEVWDSSLKHGDTGYEGFDISLHLVTRITLSYAESEGVSLLSTLSYHQ